MCNSIPLALDINLCGLLSNSLCPHSEIVGFVSYICVVRVAVVKTADPIKLEVEITTYLIHITSFSTNNFPQRAPRDMA